MLKRAASVSDSDQEPRAKRVRKSTDLEMGSPLADPHAWDIFESFLTTKTSSYGGMKPVRDPGRPLRSIFLDLEAGEDEEDEDEDEDEDFIVEDGQLIASSSSQIQTITQLPAPKHKFAAAVDRLEDKYTSHAPTSSKIRVEQKMYLFYVPKTATQFVADYLEKQGFSVKVSLWSQGQLYIISDSPKTILASLPYSHSSCVSKWERISEQDAEALEHSTLKFPNPSWVRIKGGKYKGDIAYVFDPDQTNKFVAVLIPPRDFPYPMPKGSASLFDRSRIPANQAMTDITRGGDVVGLKFKGEEYYGGLLKKNFHRYIIEQVSIPHLDDIRLHRQSGFDLAFVKQAENAFSMHILRSGDCVRLIQGEFPSEIGTTLSVDHTSGGSVHLEIEVDGVRSEIEARLQDVERVWRVGDEVRVVAGVHLGVQGHIIQKTGEIFDVCQHTTNEQIQVSQYYLDRRPLKHSLQGQLLPPQHVEPPPEHDSIEIGDFIEVIRGELLRKCGVVEWVAPGGLMVWFQDANLALTVDDTLRTPLIEVPASAVHRTRIPPTLKFMKDKAYNIRPGDYVSVARGPEYLSTGVVESVDFPKARLIEVPMRFAMKVRNSSVETFHTYLGKEVYIIGGEKRGDKCTVAVLGQHPLSLPCCDVATQYGMRLNGAILEYHDMVSFCETRKRSFLTPSARSVTPPPERLAPSRVDPSMSGSSSGVAWTSWSDGQDLHPSSPNDDPITGLASATPDPWAVDNNDVQDIIEAAAQKLAEKPGPLSWLQEYSPTFFSYRALFKVSHRFHGGRLSKRVVQTECPDPFVGPHGPAPQGTVTVRCTAKTAGGSMQHYYVPGEDLTPADPRRQGEECFILEGPYRGGVMTVSKCSTKTRNVDLKLMVGANITTTLRFDQVCVVQPMQI
ncbi:hypothetical protein F4604DRAFT_1683524 [Suillus subluteus]|nr:hypothetical protein F4604DRAFT_1683524 [Suillus subluteus]